jgi:hypothetical protein
MQGVKHVKYMDMQEKVHSITNYVSANVSGVEGEGEGINCGNISLKITSSKVIVTMQNRTEQEFILMKNHIM